VHRSARPHQADRRQLADRSRAPIRSTAYDRSWSPDFLIAALVAIPDRPRGPSLPRLFGSRSELISDQLQAHSDPLLAARRSQAVVGGRALPRRLARPSRSTNYHRLMAQWEHRGCGTLHEAGPIPPRECDVCSARRVQTDLEPGWTRVGTVPRTQRRRAGRKAVPGSRRARVYERDGGRCVQCGTTENLTLDHRVPIAKGGSNRASNLQTMCEPCNLAKADFDPTPAAQVSSAGPLAALE
jgi:5-methylcytosine-specific restriction endonuclease McrA